MYIDSQQKLSDAQAVTASAASTNVIDLGAKGIGDTDQDIIIAVTETATASGAATVTFSVQASDAEAFGSGVETIASTGAIGKADLVAGQEILKLRISHIGKRYLRVYYTVATGPLTAGKFTAAMVNNAQTNK